MLIFLGTHLTHHQKRCFHHQKKMICHQKRYFQHQKNNWPAKKMTWHKNKWLTSKKTVSSANKSNHHKIVWSASKKIETPAKNLKCQQKKRNMAQIKSKLSQKQFWKSTKNNNISHKNKWHEYSKDEKLCNSSDQPTYLSPWPSRFGC